jgi:transposase
MELAYLRRNLFGKKSESLSAHSDLFEETLQTDLAAVHAEIEQLDPSAKADPAKSTRSRAGRQPLPEHLPRIEHRHEPESCQCDQCGQNLVKIGEDVSEQLDVEPAKFFVHRHIRPQYACKTCENVTAAPIPPAIIEGGMAAPGLLSWVLTSKYLNHLPLYRLEQIAVREQVTLSRSTLAEWVGRGGVALQPYNWKQIANPKIGPSTVIQQIEFSPNFGSDNTVFVTVRGKGLYRLNMNSLGWVESTSNVGLSLLNKNIQFTEFRISPNFAQDATLIGASRTNVFLSKNGGLTWKETGHPE